MIRQFRIRLIFFQNFCVYSRSLAMSTTHPQSTRNCGCCGALNTALVPVTNTGQYICLSRLTRSVPI